jgi:hypothetical protein
MRLILIILLLNATTSFGQIERQINTLLLKKDFKLLLNFTNKYDLEKDHIQINRGNTREITKGFQESMFYIIKSYQMNKGVLITCNLRLNLITYGNQIIYFYLESKEIKNFPANTEATSDTTYKFIDTKKMLELRKQFQLTYKAHLDEKELFIDSIAVGDKCGRYPGRATFYQKQVLFWVKTVDTASLHKLLQSPNSEKQVYGVKGFYYLSLKGIKSSDEIKSLIRYIAQKNGTVYTCMPCDRGCTTILTAIKPYLL